MFEQLLLALREYYGPLVNVQIFNTENFWHLKIKINEKYIVESAHEDLGPTFKEAAKRWLDYTVFKQTEIEKLRSMCA